MKSGKPSFRDILKSISPAYARSVYRALRSIVVSILFYMCRMFPIDSKKVVLCSVWGFSDNTKYVALELSRHIGHAKVYFVANTIPLRSDQPRNMVFLKTNTLPAIYALSTARVWVECNRKEAYVKKRPGQYYIQTWHGGMPLKRIEGDCTKPLPDTYVRRAKYDSAMTDLFISNGPFATAMIRRAFWYGGEIIECGSPRLDALSGRRGKTYAGSTVLYAPTYRDGKHTDVYLADLTQVMEAAKRRFGGHLRLVVKHHPLEAHGEAYGTDTADLYALLPDAAALITDYSNTAIECAYFGIPVFLYCSDLERYRSTRGLYFEMDRLPFAVAESESALIDHIRSFDGQAYADRCTRFFADNPLYEPGDAAVRVSQRVLQCLENNP